MIDTLEAVSSTLETEPGTGSVKLQNISFDGELWKPQYPTLFNYTAVPPAVPPGLNLVPSFRIRNEAIERVKMTLTLGEGLGFQFRKDPSVFWRVIKGPDGVVTDSSISDDLTSCVLTITPGAAPVVVLQVLCQRSGQTVTKREEIEGGLFLSLVNDTEPLAVTPNRANPIPDRPKETILLEGLDAHNRLQYNLFKDAVYTDPDLVSAGLEPEPAFQIHQAGMLNKLEAKISLTMTDLFFALSKELTQDPENPKIALRMREPSDNKPAGLDVPFLKDGTQAHGKAGSIQWIRMDSSQNGYLVTSFCMMLSELTPEAKEILASLKDDPLFRSQLFGEEERDGQFGRELMERLTVVQITDPDFLSKLPVVGRVDPTIIDTPTCTMINGQEVCSGGA